MLQTGVVHQHLDGPDTVFDVRYGGPKLAALGVTVVGTSRSGTPVPGVYEIVHPDDLADAARDVDGIVVSLPALRRPKVWWTRGPARGEALDHLRQIGRGTVIDEPAPDRRPSRRARGIRRARRVRLRAAGGRQPAVDRSQGPDQLRIPRPSIPRRIGSLPSCSRDNATRYLDGRPLRNRVDTVEFY